MLNVKSLQIDRMRKNIKIFKDIGFTLDIETKLKIVDFLDIMFNLKNSRHRQYKNSNDLLLCVLINLHIFHHKLPINYQKQSMNVYLEVPPVKKFLIHLSISTNRAHRDSGYTDFEFKYNNTNTNQTKK